ncbi:MAG TPA: hypothetical protein VE075_11215, partial [Thermoanaerobaculia bacterium]|nr:hypothetical protein [Thermoanaerobaculia bacterium]
MENRFLAAIDAAVQHALPAGWPRLPGQWLPARGSVQARHAFRLARDADGAGGHGSAGATSGAGSTGSAGGTVGDGGDRRAPYLALVAVPPLAARTAAVERDLAALIDHVLARGASLLLLY